ALEAAARDQGDVCLVELAPLADPALLPSPVAAGLGVSLPADADPVDALARAAAELAAGLLARCAGLRVLATSREPLHIDGEVAWRAPSLSLPAEDDDPRASEAVRLF